MNTTTLYHRGGARYAWLAEGAVYATIHDQATADDDAGTYYVVPTAQGWYKTFTEFRVYRAILPFVGTIPAGTITAASVFLYGEALYDDAAFDLHLVDADGIDYESYDAYGDLLPKIASYGSIASGSWSTSGYNEIVLEGYALTYLSDNRTNPQFGVRTSRDISTTSPTENGNFIEGVEFYAQQYGETPNRAYLYVTYIGVPTVATDAATDILDISATLNGTVTDDGGEACQYRFRYKEAGGEYSYTDLTGSVETDATFNESIVGLTEGTTYYFNAQLYNTAGYSAWGNEKTFTTMEVTTLPATHTEATTARLNGEVTHDGGEACEYRFRYRRAFTGGAYTYTDWTGSKETSETFYEDITGLTEDYTYEFAAQIKNTAGESQWGDTLYFYCGTYSIDFPDLMDDKGRHPKNARLRAYRTDIHSEPYLIEEQYTDHNGTATFTKLPIGIGAVFHAIWGGKTGTGNEEWFFLRVNEIEDGGTGAATAAVALNNLGVHKAAIMWELILGD